MKVHLIHGIHSSNGGLTAQLVPFFDEAGIETVVHDYGYAYAATVRLANPYYVGKIIKKVESQDILLGHSNGCTISWMIQQIKPVAGMVLLQPALDEDREFEQAGWVDVYHNQHDNVVGLSEAMGFFDLFKHPWGCMGKIGYVGKDPKVTNIDGTHPPVASYLPQTHGHSDILSVEKVAPWGRYIIKRIKEHGRV